METFVAAYAILGFTVAAYVLRLRAWQRRLDERAGALEDRLSAGPGRLLGDDGGC